MSLVSIIVLLTTNLSEKADLNRASNRVAVQSPCAKITYSRQGGSKVTGAQVDCPMYRLVARVPI